MQNPESDFTASLWSCYTRPVRKREKGIEMSEWMSKAEREFFDYCEEHGCPRSCEECPFKDSCKSEELFWGCGVWEDGMGEDL